MCAAFARLESRYNWVKTKHNWKGRYSVEMGKQCSRDKKAATAIRATGARDDKKDFEVQLN